MEYDIETFKDLYPDEAKTLFKKYPDMEDDNKYIVRLGLNNGNVWFFEVGYRSDIWIHDKVDQIIKS